jgi:hypothetical protein
MASGSCDPAYTSDDAMTGTDPAPASRFARTIRGWVIPVGLATFWVIAVVWLLPRILSGGWLWAVWTLTALGPLLVLGIASRLNVWTLLVWLGPPAIAWALFSAGVRWVVGDVALVLTFVWAGGMMWSERFGAAAFRAAGFVFMWLVAAGLSAPKREAYRDLRRAMRPTDQEERDQRQLDDVARTVRAFRAQGMRIQALKPPDAQWAEVFNAAAAPSLQYADMLEGKRPTDYDEATRLIERRKVLIQDLLQRESVTHRILTYVPRH